MSKRRALTAEELDAALRLRNLWKSYQKQHNITQEELAMRVGMTQGAISKYLKGILPLGMKATVRFARALGVQPTDIQPSVGIAFVSEQSGHYDVKGAPTEEEIAAAVLEVLRKRREASTS